MNPSSWIRSLLSTQGPFLGIEIGSDWITGVCIVKSRLGPLVWAHSIETLGDQVITPRLNGKNVQDIDSLVEKLKMMLERLSGHSKKVALVVPDNVAKVSFVKFSQVPERSQDLDQLIRWKIRKTVPFQLEDAQVSYVRISSKEEAAQEFIVAVIRRDIVQEYEQVCRSAGLYAGMIDLASFNHINSVLGGRSKSVETTDWLFVNAQSNYSTIAIIRSGTLRAFRTLPSESEEELEDLVHQTAMYYEDRLGGRRFDFAVLVDGFDSRKDDQGYGDSLQKRLENCLRTSVESVDLTRVVRSATSVRAVPEALNSLAAPIGLLIR